MQEGFAVISGAVESRVTPELQLISKTAKERYAQYTKAHHEWIDSIQDAEFRNALESVRRNPTILQGLKDRFPNSAVHNVTEADELYWAVSPQGAKASDRVLVDCRYDAPFAWFPTGGVVFYRVIIACNENNTVTTVFPDEKKRVKMSTGDFHGLDYNKDWHCVEGAIPNGKHRVLLKMHYVIVPKGSEAWEGYVRFLNVGWTKISREAMRISAEPQNPIESILAWFIIACRVLFNHSYTLIFGIIMLIAAILFYRSILLGGKRLLKSRKR